MIENKVEHWAKSLPSAMDLAGRNVSEVEREFLKHEQVPCPVVHRFGPGVYMREVRVPAGSFVIGHHQNFEHMNLFLKGKVTMINDDGSVVTLQAPMSFVGKPGRKIGYAHEEMVWMNIYATDEKDVEKLEAKFLTKSEEWLESVEAANKVKLIRSDMDLRDYHSMLVETGYTEDVVRAQSENQDDMIDLPHGGYKVKVAKSDIEGQGLFATGDFEAGEVIAPARIGGKRTIAGRYTNHSFTPNAQMIADHSGDILLVATMSIDGCRGGLDGSEITINYRESLALTLKLGRGE